MNILRILDVAVELNDDTDIDIELQVKVYDSWDKRQLFYLAKLFTGELAAGQDYSILKRCVGISILDFNLTERENYHTVYRLRDEEGNELSDILELQRMSLRNPLRLRYEAYLKKVRDSEFFRNSSCQS